MRWGLVDRIDELVAGEYARGVRTYPAELPLFEDHFPRFPVVPGVLILESLAQLSGKLIGYTVRRERGDWPFPILSMMDRVKFRKFVPPDVEISLETRLKAVREEMAVVQVKARVGGKVHSQAEQIFVFNAVPLEDPKASVELEAIERSELARLWADFPGDF
jgi:3-hydroxymyristoyl/3-hydroxydecanoyl-(acyl carrier protein) dehydratase